MKKTSKTEKNKRILIAAGGTGGHMFPAQALAQQLTKEDPNCDILFMGKGLNTNKYFRRHLFKSRSIDAATPFQKSFLRKISSLGLLAKGIVQAWKWIHEFSPSVVVGFGSFHSFPVLVAAWMKRVPIVLFESNSIPGKVNRIFSRLALVSGVQFPKAKEKMKGRCVEVFMPFWQAEDELFATQKEARSYFSLHPSPFTVLVFGGSQGAVSINTVVAECLNKLSKEKNSLQVIHITGSESSTVEIQGFYEQKGILASVKPFEEKMRLAWTSADLAICRAGASTLSEIMAFEVPAILIPYPTASDQHQLKNALFLEEEVKGAFCIEEKHLTEENLLLQLRNCDLSSMKESIQTFKISAERKDLKDLVQEFFHPKEDLI